MVKRQLEEVSKGSEQDTVSQDELHHTKLTKSVRSHKKLINTIDDYKHLYISVQPMDIFCWGTGSMCELGMGPLAKNKEIKRPRLNPFLLTKDNINIISIAVGGMHTLAVDANHDLWSWGCNDVFALGRDTSSAKEVLKDMDNNESDDSDDDGDLNELESTPMKLDRKLFPPLMNGSKVLQIAATDNLSCVLFDNNDIYSWGTFRSNEGILGFYQDKIKIQEKPFKLPKFSKYKIVQIASGKDHLLFLDEEGSVFAWGNGQQYQLGRKIMDRFKLRTLDPRPIGLKKIKYIASGENHCFALNTDNKLYSWGLNQFGQCGVSEKVEDGSLVTKPTLVKLPKDESLQIKMITAGEHHSLILTEDGKLYSFGRLDMCEIGISKDELPDYTYKDEHDRPRSVPIPTLIPNQPEFKMVSAGSHHSVAIAKNGICYSWGFGETYALGLGPDDADVAVPTRIKNTATTDENMIMIGCGGQFTVSGGVKLTGEESDKRADEMDD